MIVDSHAHIFPFLGSEAGFTSVSEHLWYLQLYMAAHSERVRNVDDGTEVTGNTLVTIEADGSFELKDANFRVGENGRFLWNYEGKDVYMQYMPPSLQTNTAPSNYLVAEMDHAGVDMAVLQNAHPYGRLDEFFAAATQRHDQRLVGLASVNELLADEEDEQHRLYDAVRGNDLKGIYYANRAFFQKNCSYGFDDRRYDEFWECVRELSVPVFWEISAGPSRRQDLLVSELRRLSKWSKKYPDIPCVLTHGLTPELLSNVTALEVCRDLLGHEQWCVEFLYPIHWGQKHYYPYEELRPHLREVISLVGSERVVWGSDMPNVERNCTYKQSLDYLDRVCDFLLPHEIDGILGGNILGVIGNQAKQLDGTVP